MEDFSFFNPGKVNPDEVSPAVWAYIGDAVYELAIRRRLLDNGPTKTRNLHQEAITRVRASFQAELLRKLEPHLLEKELDVVKRGRNVKSGRTPTGTEVITYRHSTAFEALIGYLYLSGEERRLQELLAQIHCFSEEIRNNPERKN
ncbi:MAG TPA: ribonuclease III domain-containing protein [Bacillota bacterium]|nr:ribonuclease III domain-containing protein [Bacillota bacterium]